MFIKIAYLILLFQNLFRVHSQDIELEGTVRIGDSFLKHLKRNTNIKMKANEDESIYENNNLSTKVEKDSESDDDTIILGNDKDTEATANQNSDSSESSDTEGNDNSNKIAKDESTKNRKQEVDDFHEREDERIGLPKVFTEVSNDDFLDIADEAYEKPRYRNEMRPFELKQQFSIPEKSRKKVIASVLSRNEPQVKKFLDHIIHDEVESIEKIAWRLQEKIGMDRLEFISMVNATCNSYKDKMKHYVAFISKQEINSDIDREYVFLDLIASSNLLLYSEERMLLNTMVGKKKSNVSEYDLEILTEELYKESVNHKRREIFSVCQLVRVCRAYPGVSDYFADLVSEILKLSDDRLKVIVNITSDLIKNRVHFFKSFLKDNIADMIGEKLTALSMDLDNLRETFSVIRSIIIHRFKLMKTTDNVLRTKTKAVRILIDIIDKTFSLATGDEMNVMTFDTFVQAVRHWTIGKRDKVDIPLKLLMEHLVGGIKFNWDEITREEVGMLTEVIMTGDTSDKYVYEDVFSKGSRYVRHDIVDSD